MADGEYSAKFTGGGNLGDVVKNLAAQLANLKTQIDAVNKASIAPKPAAKGKGKNKHKPETAKEAVQTEKQKVEALKRTLAARKEAEKQRNLEHAAEKKRLKEQADARVNERGRKANEQKKKADNREEEKKKKAEEKATKEKNREAEKQKKEAEKARKEQERAAEKARKENQKAAKEKKREDSKQYERDFRALERSEKASEKANKEKTRASEKTAKENKRAESEAATSRAKELDSLKKDILDRYSQKEKAAQKEQKQTNKWHELDTKANDKKRKHDARARAQVRAEESRGRQKALAEQRAQAASVYNQVNSGANRVLSRRGQNENTLGELNQRRGQALRSGDLRGYRAATIEAAKLKNSMANVNGLTGILRNSMIRLGTTLAATFGVFQAVRGFSEFVKSGLAFNDTLAKSEIGVAGLITALGDIRNEQGDIVTGAEAFSAAVGFARTQVEALRQDSLRTTASFGELLNTFQVSVGPGLAAGLNLDQVREITVGISQAAAAISLPQNQLAEEVRSLLSGTIQLRTTRIASVLGITNADVRRWKEVGSLATEIQSRLAAFNKASEEAARATLGGVGARLADALSQAAGKAGEGLFKTLLDAGNDLFDNVVTIRDELGRLQPNPKFIASFQTLFDAVEKIAKGVITFVSDLEKLQKIGNFIGTSVTVLFESLSVVVSTLVAGMQALSAVFEAVASWTGITAAGFGKFLGVVVTTVAVLKLMHATMLGLIGLRAGTLLLNPWVAAATILLGITASLVSLTNKRSEETAAIEKSNKGLREQLKLQKEITDNQKLASQAANDEKVLAEIEKRMKSFAVAEKRAKEEEGGGLLRSRLGLSRPAADVVAQLREQQEIDVRTRAFLQERANRRDQGDAGGVFSVSATRRALAPFEEDIEKVEKKAEDLRKSFGADRTGLSDNLTASNKAELEANKELNEVYTLRNALFGQLRAAYKQQAALTNKSTAEERGEALANIVGTKEDIALVEQTINRFLDASRRAEASRQALAAKEAAPALREDNREIETRLRTEAGLDEGDFGERRLETLRAEAELIQLQERSRVRRLEIDQQIIAATNNANNQMVYADAQQKVALQEELDLKRNSLALEIAAAKAAERAAAARLKRAQQRETGSFGEGIEQGKVELGQELPTEFEAGVALMKGTVTQFASFASQTIVDAFDPNADGTLMERFGQFFQQIAQMWLEEMIKVRIQAGLVGAATGGTGSAVNSLGAGPIEDPSFFSKGGAVRGKGRKGKDSVRAMLAPGEFVLNADAVDGMGMKSLEAFNAGDALGGLTALTGGSTPGSMQAEVAPRGSGGRGSTGGSGGGQVVLPVLVSNERQVDQMLRGGKGALDNRMREARGRRIRD